MAEINKKDPTSAGQSGNVNNESYTFRCADVGFSDCQWKTSGRSQDEVLRNHWIVPLYDASAVYAYTDRVLEHPMPEFGAHFLDLNRIVVSGER